MAKVTLPPMLPLSFYMEPVESVAKALLGQYLVCGTVVLRITEVEAYGGKEDSASHCRCGRTPRNAPMWEEGGRAYIYLCYGMHHLLNIVTGAAGEASAVLIRACEPVEGLDIIQNRRGCITTKPTLLTGPGKVCQALGLDLTFNHHPLYETGGLALRLGRPPIRILTGARIGIDYAKPCDREAALRFAVADSPWVCSRNKLE